LNNWFNKIIAIFLFTQISFSQIYELGVSYGKSNFIGDVGDTRFINPIDDAFGGIFKWNRSARHSYRVSYIRSKLSANDLESNDPRRIERGYYFETPIDEFLVGMEFNFFDFDLHDYDIVFSPYIFSGISFTTFKDQLLINNVINSSENKSSTFGIPMILGLKYRFYDNYILSIELGARYTFSDKIDGNNVSDDYLNYNFGNINNNDWYMFTKINLTYTFGRNPCYCNIGK
jgi:hypothetical protein